MRAATILHFSLSLGRGYSEFLEYHGGIRQDVRSKLSHGKLSKGSSQTVMSKCCSGEPAGTRTPRGEYVLSNFFPLRNSPLSTMREGKRRLDSASSKFEYLNIPQFLNGQMFQIGGERTKSHYNLRERVRLKRKLMTLNTSTIGP